MALITPDRAYHPFVAMMIEGLRERGDEIIATDPGNGLESGEVLSEQKWLECAVSADAVLAFFGKEGSLAAGKPPTRAPRHHLIECLNRDGVAYLDYSEMTATGRESPGQIKAMKVDPALRRGRPWFNTWMLGHVGHYFKRELYEPRDYVELYETASPEERARPLRCKLLPLGFGMLKSYEAEPPPQGKDWDLFCCFGHLETGLRKEVVGEVQRLGARFRHRKVVVRNRLSARDYRECLRRSKIVVDAWGHGDHCYRFWEAVGARACVLYQKYQVAGPGLEDGTEAVSYSTVREFREKAEALLESREETQQIGWRGFKRAKVEHTGKARVSYVLKAMKVMGFP